ncbi:unnamed protein product, partial [marine sediment metagenome]
GDSIGNEALISLCQGRVYKGGYGYARKKEKRKLLEEKEDEQN